MLHATQDVHHAKFKYAMGVIILEFALSAVVIVVAGSLLTRFSNRISELTGLGKMFIGSVLLATATSLPELMVDIESIKIKQPDLAAGDLLGSSLFNLLVLATLDFAYPSLFRRTSFSSRYIHHALAAVLTITLTAIVGVAISAKLELAFGGLSIFSWLILAVYLWGFRLIFKDENDRQLYDQASKELSDIPSGVHSVYSKSLLMAIIGYILCAGLILFSAPFLAKASDKIALSSGLSHTFIGTTLVALCTSLPELVTTLTAFKLGAPDLALGNIFGSNAFNMLLFVPLDFLFDGVLFNAVSTGQLVTAFAVIISMSIAVLGQLYRKKERAYFTEPSSEIVIAVILGTLALLLIAKA